MEELEKGRLYELQDQPTGFENAYEEKPKPCQLRVVDIYLDQVIGWKLNPLGEIIYSWTGTIDGACSDEYLGAQSVNMEKGPLD